MEWEGVLTEPDIKLYLKLLTSGRHKSHKLNIAICKDEMIVELDKHMIACLPLFNVLKLHAIIHVDYMHISGRALPVLQSIKEWTEIPIYVLAIEADPQEQDTLRNLLIKNGFGRDTRLTGEIQVWVNRSNRPIA